jgi:hypothetical protein
VVSQLQRDMRNELGAVSQRPSSRLFDAWIHQGRALAQHKLDTRLQESSVLHSAAELKLQRTLSHEKRERQRQLEEKAKHADAAVRAGDDAEPDETTQEDTEEELRELVHRQFQVVPLGIFQLSDQWQLNRLFRLVRRLPQLVHHYLQCMVFPSVLQHQVQKLSASGQELGGSMLFRQRMGFSGTPSDLLPIELGACGYERASEGQIMSVLTNPNVVTYSLPKDWSVHQMLLDIARKQPPAHALIDTGALITGMSNKQVATFLLEHGLPTMEGVVFLDREDRQMILLRETKAVIPLEQCGIAPHQRFTFFDQVRLRALRPRARSSALTRRFTGAHNWHGHPAGAERRGCGDARQGHDVPRLLPGSLPHARHRQRTDHPSLYHS